MSYGSEFKIKSLLGTNGGYLIEVNGAEIYAKDRTEAIKLIAERYFFMSPGQKIEFIPDEKYILEKLESLNRLYFELSERIAAIESPKKRR